MKPSAIIAMILSFSVFCAGATLLVHNHLQDLNSESRPHTLYEYDLGQTKTTAQTNSDVSSEESSETESSTNVQTWISAHILHRTTKRQEIRVISDVVVPDTTNFSEETTTASTTQSTTSSTTSTTTTTSSTTSSTTTSTTSATTGSTTESTTESHTKPEPEAPKYYYLIEEDAKIFHWIGSTNWYEGGRVPDGYTIYYGNYGDLVEKGYTPCPDCFL